MNLSSELEFLCASGYSHMPPITMPSELKLAKPHKAYVLIFSDLTLKDKDMYIRRNLAITTQKKLF